MKIKKKIKKIFSRIFPERFENYWKKIKNSENIDSNLIHITESFINSKSYDTVSNYWHLLNIKNYESLCNFGIKKYGSTIARNYYTFSDLSGDDLIKNAIENLKNTNNSIETKTSVFFKKHDGFNFKESIFYNYFCYLLFYNLKLTDVFKYLSKLKNETYLGFNDPHIEIENYQVTVDKVVSLLDYDKIKKTFDIRAVCLIRSYHWIYSSREQRFKWDHVRVACINRRGRTHRGACQQAQANGGEE